MTVNTTKYRAWSIVGYAVVFLTLTSAIGAGIFVYSYILELEKMLESKWVVYNSIPSPDGKLSAVIYEMKGDATVPFNTQLSIAPVDTPFSPEKNPPFLSVNGQHDLVVRWTGERAIEVIGFPQDVTNYKKDSSIGDITVEYR